ncbi:hypothetical protein BHS07_10045 [Myxococcus xanthus]|nr:hypothetical protein BHS07_10045 [Myxococcus xanthus]
MLTVLHKLLALAQEQGVIAHVPRVKLFRTEKPAFDFLTFGEALTCSQQDGQPLTVGLMKLPLQRALRAAGISREQGRIGWHDLRHTYGSHLAMRGIPMKVIQELMGHATIEMTMRYAHLAPEARESTVQQLDRPVPQLQAKPTRDTAGAH